MTAADAIAAAVDDLRHAAALLLRQTRTTSIDLQSLQGGHKYLHPSTHAKLADAYARAIDAGLRRLPGLENHGNTLRQRGTLSVGDHDNEGAASSTARTGVVAVGSATAAAAASTRR